MTVVREQQPFCFHIILMLPYFSGMLIVRVLPIRNFSLLRNLETEKQERHALTKIRH
uniref:Uncharacterized protein n=1 Tax=Anguilla anguilla TaxID=7936 RepID=A0A0E9Y1D8_ANGAN